MLQSRPFSFAFLALALCVAGLLSGCTKNSNVPTETQSKVIYIYSDSLLDSKSQALMDYYRSEEFRKSGYITSTLWNLILEQLKALSYTDYAGAVPDYLFKCDTSSIYDANGYRTLVMEKDTNFVRNIIYVHGGAWTAQISDEHLNFLDLFLPMANARAYLPLYPLLPNYNYAATMEMLLALYQNLLKEDKPLLLMGDSAGANILLGFINYLREKGLPMPACVLPMSPAVDLSGASVPEMQKYESRDPMLSPTIFTSSGCKAWAGDRQLQDPVISPIYGDFLNFPPMFMFIGTEEILYPDAISFAEKVAATGTKTEVLIGRGLWHVAPVDNIPVTSLYCTLALEFIKSIDGK